MADRAGAGGSAPTLRGMRERMVAAAHAVAEERRHQSGLQPYPSQSSNTRSTCKPVIDGSVLRNDIKQKLAKERREEKRRQQDANKETQLLEKERKAKILYEKQMEEKQRKLKEQKEKDEQRRISAEEKRKQKLEEEREKFKAVLYRTLERSNRADYRQKRWSWEGATLLNSDSKAGDKHSIPSEKRGQETPGLQKQLSLSSASLQSSASKKKTDKPRSSSLNGRTSKQNSSSEMERTEEKPPGYHRYTNLRETTLLARLLIPTKASVARCKSVASLSAPGKDTPDTRPTLIQYANMSLRNRSRDELKAALVLPKLPSSMTHLEKVETLPEVSLQANPDSPSKVGAEPRAKVREESPLEGTSKAPPRVEVEALPEKYRLVPPEVSYVVPSKESMEKLCAMSPATSSQASVEAFLLGNMKRLPGVRLHGSEESSPEGSVDPSPEVSIGSSPEVSVDPSPEVSVDSSPDVSVDPSPEVSMSSSPDVSVEASSEASPDSSPTVSAVTSPKTSEEVLLRERAEMSSEANMARSPSVQKSDTVKQIFSLVTKRPSTGMPSYKWPSSLPGWHPPFPVNTKQIQKTRSSSPSPGTSRMPLQYSLSYKVSPAHHTVLTQSALGATRKRKETVSKTPKRSESVNLKMSCDESGNKSAPGTLNAEEATKILAEKRRLAREQREKEAKFHQEMDIRQETPATQPTSEDQEEISKSEDGQQPRERERSGHDQDEPGAPHQKGDTKISAQEEAEKRKMEHERIMLQNLKERLERKKRIEEIMKRTRKADWNASKSVETSGKNTYKADKADEDEADDENESESEDSFSDFQSAAFINSVRLSSKPKVHFQNARKKAPKLVFLDPTSTQINSNTQAFLNGEMKSCRQKSGTDPSAQAKGSRSCTKRMTNRAVKSRKVNQATKTVGLCTGALSQAQDWVHNKIVDTVSETEPRVSSITPASQKHHPEGPTMSHPKEVPLDVKIKESLSPQRDV